MKRIMIIISAVFIAPSLCLDADAGPLRPTMAGYLRSGADTGSIPDNHPLTVLRYAPATATVTWLLFHADTTLLEETYSTVDRTVMDYFTEQRTSDLNFLKGLVLDDGSDILSPGLNSLAALELHSLSLIASATGRYSEAIELRKLSREYTLAVTDYFFDHTSGMFLNAGPEGSYISIYRPSQLLPLVIDGSIDEETATRISGRFIYEVGRRGAEVNSLWDYPASRVMVKELISSVEGFPGARLNSLPGTGTGADVHPSWKALWTAETVRVLFPECDELFVIKNLMLYLESERLMTDRLETTAAGLDSLTQLLSAQRYSLDTHIAAISVANTMLASLSETNTTLEEGIRIWKVFDEYRWGRLSMREQKRVTGALASVTGELMAAKRLSSESFTGATGIRADVRLPDRPVHRGGGVGLEARIWTTGSRIELERLYLQAGAARWSLTGTGDLIRLAPGSAPEIWERTLSLPPGSKPGLMSIPVFFDFMSEGRRVEIHSSASLTVTSGYDISINYPLGKRIGDEPLPINITVRHGKGQTIQGVVEGVFYSDLGCRPELPARFRMKAGEDITNLPLEIDPSGSLPPGRYPFTITVRINGRTVAAFEDELVKNIEWLHLGPLPNRSWVIDNATSLQNDLTGEHSLSDGRHITWNTVPLGAFDAYGAIRPDRLYGSGSDRCMLLYTALKSDSRRKIRWNIDSKGPVNLWVNEIRLKEGEAENSGLTMLRKGHNSLLVSVSWSGSPDPFMLELSDENGMPLVGVTNDVKSVAREFARVEATTATPAPDGPPSSEPREVTFTIVDPGASEVSLIGEFNNWSPDAAPMKLTPAGNWSVTLFLPPGTYSYKFLVDRKQKLADPSARGSEPDGFGGLNSVINIK